MKLNKLQLEDLILIVTNQLIEMPFFRFGQSFWNNLITNYPEFKYTHGTNLDCFYVDNRVKYLIKAICDEEAIAYWESLDFDFPLVDLRNYNPAPIMDWAKNHGYL